MHHRATEPAVPIIFLPGLNGDPRVFGPQAEAFPTLSIARWAPPMDSETLAAYAARLARSIDPQSPCVVGGVSFGGIVALEVARHLDARACLLIASSRDVAGLPAAVRFLRPIARAARPAALSWITRSGEVSAVPSFPRFRRRLARLSAEEMSFRRWAFGALLTWQPPHLIRCPILQIHGECDSTVRASRTKADVLLPHAGHLLTLTHAEHVNMFLRSAIERYAA